MCGIVGYTGATGRAKDVLLDGLKRLEYRGYDSAGVALFSGKDFCTYRSVGKVASLVENVSDDCSEAASGIAHTRWATHGKPEESNAHPHASGKIHLVHNGIIENYRELRDELIEKGHVFTSETDSEVIAHLIDEENKTATFEEAVKSAVGKLAGAYGLLVSHDDEPSKLIAVRYRSPLVVGIGDGEMILASDAAAVIAHTKKVIYLDDGDLCVITPDTTDFYHNNNNSFVAVEKDAQELTWDDTQAQKNGYEHFMKKEIDEQPEVIADAMRGRIDRTSDTVILEELEDVSDKLGEVEKIVITSCGTSYNAGLVSEYMFEEYLGIDTDVEYASEYRYRTPVVDEKTLCIVISQSGETADTLQAMREAKAGGAMTLGIINVMGSTIAREADAVLYTRTGPEIGVASTKAFVTQLVVLALLMVYMGQLRTADSAQLTVILEGLEKLPGDVEEALKLDGELKALAGKYATAENFFYLGRKYNYPIAMEGALKIKEISYVHAEAYAAGEMKHGPIALIDETFPTVMLTPKDSVYEKTASAIEELRARSGQVIAITTEDAVSEIEKISDDVIAVPTTVEPLQPLLMTIPLQLFAYHFGVARGLDVDQPRNLAKSVTVE